MCWIPLARGSMNGHQEVVAALLNSKVKAVRCGDGEKTSENRLGNMPFSCSCFLFLGCYLFETLVSFSFFLNMLYIIIF